MANYELTKSENALLKRQLTYLINHINKKIDKMCVTKIDGLRLLKPNLEFCIESELIQDAIADHEYIKCLKEMNENKKT